MDAAKGTVGLLALLTTFVVGGASGYAARLGVEGGRRGGEVGSNVEAPVAGIESALVEIRSALEEWNRRLDAPSVAAAPAREPQSPDKEPLDLARLGELVARLERAEQTIAARTAGSLVIPQGRPHPTPPKPTRDEDSQELRERYLLQSYQQILDTFGRPDGVETSGANGGSVMWSYDRDAGKGETRGFDLYFRDGLVVDIDWPTPPRRP